MSDEYNGYVAYVWRERTALARALFPLRPSAQVTMSCEYNDAVPYVVR